MEIVMRLNDIFWMVINKKEEPTLAKDDTYRIYRYYPEYIIDYNDGETFCGNEKMYDFLELLTSFVGGQLAQKSYIVKDNKKGFSAEMTQKEKIRYLKITLLKNNKIYYLEKYDCRVIVANARRIISKCSIKDMRENNWQQAE